MQFNIVLQTKHMDRSCVMNDVMGDAEPRPLLLQITMAMPFLGATVNPKTAIRRAYLATAVAVIMWGMWKHTDNEQETLR